MSENTPMFTRRTVRVHAEVGSSRGGPQPTGVELGDMGVERSRISRRRFLSTAAKVAAAGGVAGVAPGLVRGRAKSAPVSITGLPDPKGNPIEHVVVLNMENRSFDHYFGSLSLPAAGECRLDVEGLQPGMSSVGADGRRVGSFHLTDYCQELDPPHGFSASKVQYANGTNGGYLLALDPAHPRKGGGENKKKG